MNLSIVILPAKILADGTHKLRISIAHNGTTRYFPTRFVVPSVDCLKNGAVTNKVGNASYINQQLRSKMNDIYKAYDAIPDAECYTCSMLVQLIKEKITSSKANTFDFAAEEWLMTKKTNCSPTTYNMYAGQIKRFSDFIGKGCLLQMITPKKIWEYDAYLKKTINETSVSINFSAVRGVIKFAVTRKYVEYSVYPFTDYKKKQSVSRDCCIPVDVLRKVRDYKPTTYGVARAIDVFMLSFYLCGMNIVDMMSVNFSGDCVTYVRQKTFRRRRTAEKTEFIIQPEAREIINKYIDKSGHLNLFRAKKVKNIHNVLVSVNASLKIIAKHIGFDGRLIFYCARKTFAQLCYLHNVPERVIAYCIGDTYESKSAIGYYIKANKNLADKSIRKVLDFVKTDKIEDDLFGSNIVQDK